MEEKIYDVIVIGAGPAGISSAIYAKRAGKDVLILEKFFVGGQLGLIGEIENYAGFGKISGSELADKFYSHAKSLEIPIRLEEVVDYNLTDEIKEVKCKNNLYKARAIILALGSYSKELNIEGEKEFKGKGVSYCALCDGNFFKGKDVAVVGSGDSAFSDALYLSNVCNKVYILTKNTLKINNYSEKDLKERPNITLLKNSISKEIKGKDRVESLMYEKDNEINKLSIDGIFVAIGRRPETENLQGKIQLNERGYIITNDRMNTNIEGVFACGDVRVNVIKQIATAVGDGAIAGTEASKYVDKMKIKNR